ncbi:unnamed protein product, partial [Musa banksii]
AERRAEEESGIATADDGGRGLPTVVWSRSCLDGLALHRKIANTPGLGPRSLRRVRHLIDTIKSRAGRVCEVLRTPSASHKRTLV